MDVPLLIKNDPWLNPFTDVIKRRQEKAIQKEVKLLAGKKDLKEFACGHHYFGLHQKSDGWIFREWAPNANKIYLLGEFNQWKEDSAFTFQPLENGIWELYLPFKALKHNDLYRLLIYWDGGKGDRIPAWATRAVQDSETKIFNAQVWFPEKPYIWKNPQPRKKNPVPLIYETHIGMASESEKVATYSEFRENVLPMIIKAGYNTLQLMAIQEHPYYGSFGYQVSSFFAPSSRFGTPDELKALIDEAHGADLSVIMDMIHSHAVKNEIEGLAKFDGTPYQFFHDEHRREHIAWDSLCFDYRKEEILHFLLSNCKFWLEEYHFDGFRFDGITSMLYLDHGLSINFTSYDQYFDGQQDEDAITYLILVNKLIKQTNPEAITIAEEMSGMPGLASPIDHGGFGFDYRMAMGTPDYWIKIIKEVKDENWNVREIYYELIRRRYDEKTVGYAESHDQALVGDKTIIFRLMDKEIYYNMSIGHDNLIIERGMALHKMIRLATISTSGGGYLNFMGNEFGHPEWVDFPREGNNWSFTYARRQWSLLDNKQLRYHLLAAFDRDMLEIIKKENCLLEPHTQLILENNSDQVLIFKRANLIFVFNFNPYQSFPDYGFKIDPGKYRIILNTDAAAYGGQDRIDQHMDYYTTSTGKLSSPHYLKLYIPSRTAFVLKEQAIPGVYG